MIASPGTELNALLQRVLANPGPGQYVGSSVPLKAFDKRALAVRGRGDSRVFDAIGSSLQW
jgi:hypothetical protein